VNPVRHVVYLHGFASSPQSSKAERFGRELKARGVGFSCPDLNEPDFERLTVTRMINDIRRLVEELAERPVALVGSSLGGFVAVHAAHANRVGAVDRLILLAPALDFGRNREGHLGDTAIEAWRRAGRAEVFHHGYGMPRTVGFDLYEDAARYDAFRLEDTLPTLVFQGLRDDVVPPDMVRRWAEVRSTVEFRPLDDGHQLSTSMDEIWDRSEHFLGLGAVDRR
jgi:pimeloyl-ACP methyl ester carboxylesterase